MKTIAIKDLMVPLEEYATVSEEATLFEAVTALEKAQETFENAKYPYLHRAILVYDKDNQIIGKISQLDVLRALEPKYDDLGDVRKMSYSGFSPQFLKTMLQQGALWESPIRNICSKAGGFKVKTFMYTPTENEYINEDATLDEAIHLLVMGHHQSLLVTRGKEIIGILKLTDVFSEIFHIMKTCEV